ncbi:MAG TPA: HAMP domain-containing sensor histidine kinase [Anaerolineaceae bacterium]|nr:HAMP domain-containing sensor histidine kinase [Anaerolineaceae bacterium]
MMFRSLRSRLWITYAFLILTVLLIVGVGVVLALRDSPLLYRQTAARIKVAETVLVNRLDAVGGRATDRAQRLLETESSDRQLRFLILDQQGQVIEDYFDSSINSQLSGFVLPVSGSASEDILTVQTMQDQRNRTWIYSIALLNNGEYLVTAAQRPVVLLRNLLTDDTVRPFLQAGLAALFLAFLLSLLMGEWISLPLKRMAAGALRLAQGHYQPVRPEGPKEVRQLAEAWNDMVNQVQSSQQSQRDFIANVTHELKTPLTSIQGFSQAILDGTVRDEAGLRQAAEVIHGEAARMNRLVLDLLALAKLEAGTADLSYVPVDMVALLNYVVQKFSLQAGQAQIDLRATLPALPKVSGDGDRLGQVFTNLVDNALKFTPAGGQVVISAEALPGGVRVAVVDCGPGIPAEERSRIFERFYQMDKARKGGGRRGVGLGLPIARQIVLLHGGKIWVESNSGKGSIFYVELPCNDHRTLQK